MELTSTGRLIAWLGVSLLVVGFLLSNTMILFSATLLLFCLLLQGISFHRAVENARCSIRLESQPKRIETTVGHIVRIENLISNQSRSRFHIASFSRSVPLQVNERNLPSRFTLASNGVQRIETLLQINLPGNLELNALTILLEGRARLYRQSLRMRDTLIIIVQPLLNGTAEPIETEVLADLAVDHLRRGSGTDLAGIRPFNFSDDFRGIDWKATARTGKLMTRESYLERDPTVILMIDASSSTNTRGRGSSVLDALLSDAGTLLTGIRPASSMGLIMYDDREIIAHIKAQQGVNSRERILRTLLERTKPASTHAPLQRRAIRPYADLVRETNALTRETALAAKTKTYWERFLSFASSILPFYERAEAKYSERVRKQGAFKAFEIVCNLPEPALLIVISEDMVNVDGLVEGMKLAARFGHRVILAIIAQDWSAIPVVGMRDLERFGISILKCTPENVFGGIRNEILAMSHARILRVGTDL